MIKTAEGIAKSIIYQDEDISKLIVLIREQEYQCINYKVLTGDVHAGDRLLLNTTAVELQLGTGGFHFVIANLSKEGLDNLGAGHIMKLKYTPIQLNCMTTETQESAHHNVFNEFRSLDGMPIIIGSLHSVLAPCSIYLKNVRRNLKVCYIMTEGGAPPIYVSEIVKQLKNQKYIDATITYGNAFGGDYECVNIYTALVTAKEIVKADVAIICMGPGIVGTDTRLGFSGAEQAGIGDAVNKLGGFPIAVPRISFSDTRIRHHGISHHSITVLRDLCCTKMNVAIPTLSDSIQMEDLKVQLKESQIESQHNVYYVDSNDIESVLSTYSSYFCKMGRNYSADKEYFITCAASAKLCINKFFS